jgi:5'-3' exonuclease
MDKRKSKILVVIDGSYWLYVTLFSAISDFQKKCPLEAGVWIKDADSVDQKNLPDLTLCEPFKRILKKAVMKKCEAIDWMLKNNFQDEIDTADGIDFVFAQDDKVSNSFRKKLYPEYKANRRLIKKSYDTYKIQRYIIDVLFKELKIEERYSYHLVKVPNAEGDDVIATIFRDFGKEYMLNVLFASDRDFVQLDNVTQINMQGKIVECKLGEEPVTHKEYLLGKIIMGDSSDNITKVFPKIGVKRAFNLIRNKDELRKRLKESQEAASQYELNKKLISFDEIPSDLVNTIKDSVSKVLYREEAINSNVDLKDFMML